MKAKQSYGWITVEADRLRRDHSEAIATIQAEASPAEMKLRDALYAQIEVLEAARAEAEAHASAEAEMRYCESCRQPFRERLAAPTAEPRSRVD